MLIVEPEAMINAQHPIRSSILVKMSLARLT